MNRLVLFIEAYTLKASGLLSINVGIIQKEKLDEDRFAFYRKRS